jgi:LysM repeat protein
MKILQFSSFLTLGLLLSLAAPLLAQKQRIETRGDKQYIIHKVQAKETLYSIAKLYSVKQDELITLNPTIAQVVKVGDIVSVPYLPEDESEEPSPILKESNTTQALTYTKHKVGKGEGLMKIARDYGVELEEIQKWNELSEKSTLTPGQELIVGISSGKSPKKNNEQKTNNTVAVNNKNLNKTNPKSAIKQQPKEDDGPTRGALAKPEGTAVTHEVATGETLSKLKVKYGVSIAELRSWNTLTSDELRIGQKLKIYPKINPATDTNPIVNNTNPVYNNPNYQSPQNQDLSLLNQNNTQPNTNSNPQMNDNQATLIYHTLKEGENIYELQNKYNIRKTEIRYWNGMAPDDNKLIAGKALKIYLPNRLTHTVQQGETPEMIANRYNVNPAQIEIWNKITKGQLKNDLKAGKVLTIFQPTGPTPPNDFRENNPNHTPNTNNTQPNYQSNHVNTTQPEFFYHTVSQGQFLLNIAQLYGVTARELMEWNNMQDAQLIAGQNLKVRRTRGVSNHVNTTNNNTGNYTQPGNTQPVYNQPNYTRPQNNTVPANNNPAYNQPTTYTTTATSGDPFDMLNNSTITPTNPTTNTTAYPNEAYRGLPNNNNQPVNNTYNPNNNQPVNNNYNPNNTYSPNNNATDYGANNTAQYLNPNYTPNNNNNWNNPNPNIVPNTVMNGREVAETGFAQLVENINAPQPYVALHRTVPPGTMVLVKNITNGKSVVVYIAAPLNPNEVSSNVVIEMTPASFERLGAGTNKTLQVELIYTVR